MVLHHNVAAAVLNVALLRLQRTSEHSLTSVAFMMLWEGLCCHRGIFVPAERFCSRELENRACCFAEHCWPSCKWQNRKWVAGIVPLLHAPCIRSVSQAVLTTAWTSDALEKQHIAEQSREIGGRNCNRTRR